MFHDIRLELGFWFFLHLSRFSNRHDWGGDVICGHVVAKTVEAGCDCASGGERISLRVWRCAAGRGATPGSYPRKTKSALVHFCGGSVRLLGHVPCALVEAVAA